MLLVFLRLSLRHSLPSTPNQNKRLRVRTLQTIHIQRTPPYHDDQNIEVNIRHEIKRYVQRPAWPAMIPVLSRRDAVIPQETPPAVP